MSRRVRLAPEARRDIAAIARESLESFGGTIWSAYRVLLEQALSDLGEDSDRPGSRDISDVRPGYRLFHLRYSRRRVAGRRIGRPRHVVIYRLTDGSVVILRVLHERMLLSRHL